MCWCQGKSSQGSKAKSNNNFYLCHQHVNSVPSINFQKIAIPECFVAMHKFESNCISKNFSEWYLQR